MDAATQMAIDGQQAFAMIGTLLWTALRVGALLMAMGLGYDSDGGRAMAATITSLMTGTSYKRSAELAGIVGPYAGYARNADAHKRVMRKHQAANDQIRTMHTMDKDIHAHATKAWEAVVKTGEKNGFRNAQASVLAPTDRKSVV